MSSSMSSASWDGSRLLTFAYLSTSMSASRAYRQRFPAAGSCRKGRIVTRKLSCLQVLSVSPEGSMIPCPTYRSVM
jgi:hypothetical protein